MDKYVESQKRRLRLPIYRPTFLVFLVFEQRAKKHIFFLDFLVRFSSRKNERKVDNTRKVKWLPIKLPLLLVATQRGNLLMEP